MVGKAESQVSLSCVSGRCRQAAKLSPKLPSLARSRLSLVRPSRASNSPHTTCRKTEEYLTTPYTAVEVEEGQGRRGYEGERSTRRAGLWGEVRGGCFATGPCRSLIHPAPNRPSGGARAPRPALMLCSVPFPESVARSGSLVNKVVCTVS